MAPWCSSHLDDEALVVPAFPVFTDNGENGNASFVASLCWPVMSEGHCGEHSPAYWTASNVLNSSSSLAIMAAGMLALINSDFSDEISDFASAMTVANGLFGLLAHATRLRVLEDADMLSMHIAAQLFFKGMVRALFPVFNRSQYLRTVLNIGGVSIIFTAAC